MEKTIGENDKNETITKKPRTEKQRIALEKAQKARKEKSQAKRTEKEIKDRELEEEFERFKQKQLEKTKKRVENKIKKEVVEKFNREVQLKKELANEGIDTVEESDSDDEIEIIPVVKKTPRKKKEPTPVIINNIIHEKPENKPVKKEVPKPTFLFL